MKKKVDNRIRYLIENGVRLGHRSLIVMVGDKARDQVVNLHYMMNKVSVKKRSNVLWCYKKDLGFSSHRQKRMRQIKKEIQRGIRDPDSDDPFELFITCTDIRFCYYRDTHKILGNTFGMCILQDFEALTPNLLARTIETVEGGGLVIVLLKTMQSLKQLFAMTMDVHSRYRTESQQDVICRFNERFILSLSSCKQSIVMDDELNVLPISSHVRDIQPVELPDDSEDAFMTESKRALRDVQESVAEVKPVGSLVAASRTVDQAKAIMTCIDAVSEKTLRSVVSVTAARGRGKSSALGLAIAGAVAYGYANIFVTAPSPENLKTLFEMIFKGFDALEYKEHMDYEIIQSTNPEWKHTVVRVNIFRQHRQTIQYIHPGDAARLAQAELLVIDEAAAIPLPMVKELLGPYLVFMSSTINGYEGTGRSLSLKLLQQLRQQTRSASKSNGANSTALREVELVEPIRYNEGDAVESWLNALLCLDCTKTSNRLICSTPHPSECELFYVNRDTLFSYHKASELFLHRLMNLFVSSHYKNSPNDLQLMSDAPGHHLFVLLGPVKAGSTLPDILCAIHVALEGHISKESVMRSLGRGIRASGDLIPWTISQQFQDHDFARLSGARVVRIATHPDLQKMGYGTRALEQLCAYYQGELTDISESLPASNSIPSTDPTANGGSLLSESITPRNNLPPLLEKLTDRPAEALHWVGTSYGLTQNLFSFWKRSKFEPVYLRQTPNETTGEHTCVMLRALSGLSSTVVEDESWLDAFGVDFRRRVVSLLPVSFRKLPVKLGLSLVNPSCDAVSETSAVTTEAMKNNFLEYDIRRLESYSRNLVDYHMILDLLPTISRMLFIEKLPVHLSPVQAALLVGMGLQHKTVENLHKELGLESNQLLALFQKVMRKVSTLFRNAQEKQVRSELPEVFEKEMNPVKQSLSEDLKQGANEALEALQTKQAELLREMDLGEYAIGGNDKDWEKATSNLGTGGPNIVSVLSAGDQTKKQKKREREPSGDKGSNKKKSSKKSKDKKKRKL